ncbi:centrosomal P4.1-associated protein-like [Glandiceps talaboti]
MECDPEDMTTTANNLPLTTTTLPSAFLTSTAWTSRAGVVLNFHPPVHNANNDNTTKVMQTTENRTALMAGGSSSGTDGMNSVSLGLVQGDGVNIHNTNGPLNRELKTELYQDTLDEDESSEPISLLQTTDPANYNSTSDLDTSGDVFEQQAAKEQARLLHRFKQLKQWQQEQQDKLIRQQQEQLQQFKSEQQRVKSMIALQRQIQWGGSGTQSSMTEPSLHKTASTSSKPSIKPSSIPQVLASKIGKSPHNTYASLPTEQQPVYTHPNQPLIPQPSLPVDDERETYDSELDSASDVPSSTMIEGVEPLPETASEFSDLIAEDKHSRDQPLVSMVTGADNDDRIEKSSDENEESVPSSKSPMSNFDDLPVTAAINGRVKTFEELLEEKLQQDEALNTEGISPENSEASRKPFLRKGQGIARFGMAKEPAGKAKISPQQVDESKASGSVREKSRNEKVISPKKKKLTSTSPKVARKIASKGQSDTNDVFKHPQALQLHLKPHGGKAKNPAITMTKETTQPFNDTMEMSFQNRMKDLEKKAELEKQELEEFEILEKAADNTSFSSNVSVVTRVLNRQQPRTLSGVDEHSIGLEDEVDDVPDDSLLERGSATEDEDDTDRTLEADNTELDFSQRNSSHVDFNDSESWGDFSQVIKDSDEEEESEDEGSSDHDNTKDEESIIAGSVPLVTSTPPVRRKTSQDSKSIVTKEMLPEPVSTPPTSGLMTKLFPQLKPVVPKETQQQQQQQQLHTVSDRPLGEGVQSKLLKDKLAELETEIEKFRRENATLLKLREDREKAMKQLQKEMKDFEKYKQEELQRLEEHKEDEMKKLKREKKTFEKYQKAARAMPDKREREEIDMLQKQVQELQEELDRKETRWNSSNTRLRNRLENLEEENQELKNAVQVLERKRLESWKNEEKTAARGKGKGQKKTSSKNQDVLNHDKSSESSPTESTSMNTKKTQENRLVNERSKVKRHTDGSAKESKSIDEATPQTICRDELLPEDTPRKQLPITSPTKQSSQVDGFEGYNSEAVPKKPVHRKRAIKFGNPGDSNPNYELKTPIRSTEEDGQDVEEVVHPDGKVECIYNSGRRVITFTNGTRKEISPDGQTIIVSFFNGDIKQIMPDQRVIYYYAEAKTTHTTYPDGLEVLQFPNNQIEKHYPDGTKEITFPDHTIKYLFPNGCEESIFPDGTVLRVDKNGDRTMEFPNGQREIHTSQYKKREYPDGTVKTVYPDGRQETRYSNGRIRVKDKDGRVIVDRMC